MEKIALSFGVFDGVHQGHLFFLENAKKYSDLLMISLARDEIVLEMKGSAPMYDYNARKTLLEETGLVDRVVKGDHEIGTFRSVSLVRPQVICLGYDQIQLDESLKIWMKQYNILIPIIKIEPFHPEKYKSSLLNSK